MRQVDMNYSPVQLEKDIRTKWEEDRTYEKVKKASESGKPYYILDGPPYTTGSIHIGTAWNKVLKDCVLRFRRMQGLNVRDQPGYDMHGLPIEVKVEQSMNITSKKEIEEQGMDRFVETCRDFAQKFKTRMTDEFKQLGVWMDWDRPYLTVDAAYIGSVWWTIKQAYDKGLLTVDLRVLPWCPRCETALAEAEIEYWDETDPSIYVKFPLVDAPGEYLLIWTTTPWTIPGNLAAAVHPDFTYARMKVRRGTTEEILVLVESRVDELVEIAQVEDAEILETVKGAELVGLHYTHPLKDLIPYQQQITNEWAHAIVPSETVTDESTGVVHIAPGHGPEDFEIGAEFELEPFSPVDESGKYTDEVGEDLAGMKVRDANDAVMIHLVDRGAMFHEGTVKHRYGHCWRCKKPIIYRVTDQWFLKVTDFKEDLVDANNKVTWYPDWAGTNRQNDWIANARDWCISRQRFWGTPVPIWTCSCGNIRVVSSLQELREADGYTEGMDVHRPWIDALTYKCDKCSQVMRRVPDVLDVWLDAGVCSWASLGYPAETEEFERWWPSEWITEAHDQTRGWFYSQLVTGVLAFGRSPYNSVLMHGWAFNPEGQAMSKSEGTAIEPINVVNAYGADSLRLYIMKANAPWEDIQFQEEGVKSANRTLNILWNVYKFAALYMSIDGFDPKARNLGELRESMKAEDLWMVSRLESLKRDVAGAMESYEIHRAARAIETLVLEDLSRWYVKLVRDRLWKEGEDIDKTVAFKVLHEALSTCSTLLAPITPHIAEAIHSNLDRAEESVHMVRWPSHNADWIDSELDQGMELVREISEVIARVRQESNVNLRWPLKRIVIRPRTDETSNALQRLKHPLLAQNNIKSLQVVPVGEEWDEMMLSVIPNPNAIGKVYRQWSSKIAVLLKNRPAKAVKAGVDKGEYSLGIEGQLVKILPNMVSFTSTLPPDVVSAEFSDGIVYIDLEETPALQAEGFAREVIRRVQQMRKDMKLDVEEYVRIEIECGQKLSSALETWGEHVSRETRAREIEIVEGPKGDYVVEWNVSGEPFVVGVTSLKMKEVLRIITDAGIGMDKALRLYDAGYNSAEALKNAGQDDVASIEGLSRAEAKTLYDYIHRNDAKAAEDIMPSRDTALAAERAPEPPVEGAFMEQLMRLPGMAEEVAKALHDAGYISPQTLRNTSVDDLVNVTGVGRPLAEKLIEAFSGEAALGQDAGGAGLPAPEVHELERSFSYLVEEDRPEASYKLFLSTLEKGMKGYCITRNYPAKIRSKFDLKDVPIVWLSNVGRDNSIRPKDLEKLSLSLEQFLSQPDGGIVLLDGLEYLITNNNFITVLRLIQSLRDQVAINQSILLMAVNRSTLESHQLNLLEREVDYTITG
ncbi:MAG: isoleucine--tRNA ligase [Methanobacteriota archaeon]|nr:MAG: isoleucine--tRNA ligase [Euryarchaeota archaeon]